MNRTKKGRELLVALSAVVPVLVFASPIVANAQLNLFGNTTNQLVGINIGNAGAGGGTNIGSTVADQMCTKVDTTCPCGSVKDKNGKCQNTGNPAANPNQCPMYCKGPTPNGGYVIGHCVMNNVCHGDTYTGLNGKSSGTDAGLSALGQVLGQLMGKLMQGSQGSGSGSSAGTGGTTGTNGSSAGCTSFYAVSYPSSDPCAYYVPNTSSLLGSSTSGLTSGSDLLNALGNTNTNPVDLTSGTNISSLLTPDQSLNTIVNDNTNTNTNTNTEGNVTATTTATTTVSLNPNLGGAQGNIEVLPGGATIVANTVDTSGNTAVAGFYGADTFGTQQPTSLVGQLCQNRPWASNFLSYIIPPSFFDGLCQWRGYQVGTPQAAQTSTQSNVTLTQTSVPAPAANASATTTQTVPAKVQIWAVPAAVPLGARTSIYWTTQGVTNCTETSPDGNFSQNSLQGTGATVPLTGATTFTISCQAADGTPVTDYVTVNIAI